jgi:hypothetical protein
MACVTKGLLTQIGDVQGVMIILISYSVNKFLINDKKLDKQRSIIPCDELHGENYV